MGDRHRFTSLLTLHFNFSTYVDFISFISYHYQLFDFILRTYAPPLGHRWQPRFALKFPWMRSGSRTELVWHNLLWLRVRCASRLVMLWRLRRTHSKSNMIKSVLLNISTRANIHNSILSMHSRRKKQALRFYMCRRYLERNLSAHNAASCSYRVSRLNSEGLCIPDTSSYTTVH